MDGSREQLLRKHNLALMAAGPSGLFKRPQLSQALNLKIAACRYVPRTALEARTRWDIRVRREFALRTTT
jgi:hypothetical protein